MRNLSIILVLILMMTLYCVLHMDYVDYVLETGYNITYAKPHLESEVNFNPISIFPRSTYDVGMVNWALTCTMSPAYLADLAYTLKQITDVLEEFEIMYMLDSGTLLGALRMNGPLPYDDDIDITVLEEDFKPKKHLVYDAMEKRNFRVSKHADHRRTIDQFVHKNNQSSSIGFKRPFIDLFMLRRSRDMKYMEFVCLPMKKYARCPFKMSTIFGAEQQPPSPSPHLHTISTPRAPQVIPRAQEDAWHHYKDHQRKARGVFRPGLQRILHHRYGMLSTLMFLGRLYPVAADPFSYSDCQNDYWYSKYIYMRPHPILTESELCRTAKISVYMAPLSQSNITSYHKRGAAISAYVMLQRLKETMCYQAKESADIMLQGKFTNNSSSVIVAIEEEFNATDTMLFRQMCSTDEALCKATFMC